MSCTSPGRFQLFYLLHNYSRTLDLSVVICPSSKSNQLLKLRWRNFSETLPWCVKFRFPELCIQVRQLLSNPTYCFQSAEMILGKLSAFRTSTNCSSNFWQKYLLCESSQQIQNFLADSGTGFPRDTLKDYPATAELLREFNGFILCHLPAFQPFNNSAAVYCFKEKLFHCKDL